MSLRARLVLDVVLTVLLTLVIRFVYLAATGDVMAWWLAAVIAIAIVYLGAFIWPNTSGNHGSGVRSGSGSFLDDLF